MKRLVVLGAAESGIGAAILAQRKGYEVFVSDKGKIQEKYRKKLDENGILWEEGTHSPELLLNATEVIKSPGIPDSVPIVRAIREKGVKVISEIEFAGRYTKAKTICITGSNGKTTTTSLIYHILKNAGFNVGLAGNIGRSFALQVVEDKYDWYVIELSSFQLDNMYDFRADVSVLLNITPDHLDRYDYKMENYVAAKMRILQNQKEADTFIYWAEDEYVPSELKKRNPVCRCWSFSDEKRAGAAAYMTENALTQERPMSFSCPVNEIKIVGKHNLRNAMAATLAASAAGVKAEYIKRGLRDFPGVEHRLEFVLTKNGVRYVNDSKATNVDACYCALESMSAPVVLILGGLDKGNDYNALSAIVKEKCRALVFLGADNRKLKDFFKNFGLPMADTHSMTECVKACAGFAASGDTVLLSPCCASFDLFRNMEDRGEQFKENVSKL